MGSLYPWSANNRAQVFFMSGNPVLNSDGKFQKTHSRTLGQGSSQVKDKKQMLTKELRRADTFLKQMRTRCGKQFCWQHFIFPMSCLSSSHRVIPMEISKFTNTKASKNSFPFMSVINDSKGTSRPTHFK